MHKIINSKLKNINVLWLFLTIAVLDSSGIIHAAEYAPFSEGVSAFDKGKYKSAYSILYPLAESGNSDAQFYIGYMYDEGLGVKEKDQNALEWYENAAKQGNKAAEKGASLIRDNLMQDALNKAKEPWK